MDNNFIDNAINKNEDLINFSEKVEFIQLAFILNNIVEKVMNHNKIFSDIVLNDYIFTDKTKENTENYDTGMFEFTLNSKNGNILNIRSSEDLWAIMASNPLIVKVPDDLDVQSGWRYTDKDGFFLV
jgi:hypothetical protein